MINDFTMHLLFQNGLEYKNADRREKQWDKDVEVKDKTVNISVFIQLFSFTIDHTSIYFFFSLVYIAL